MKVHMVTQHSPQGHFGPKEPRSVNHEWWWPKATTWDFFQFILFLIIYIYVFFTTIIYCILIIYLFLFYTHNYMNCYKSAQVCPATTMLGHTLVMLRIKGRYEGAQIHPVFRTWAQWAQWTEECQPQNGIPRQLYGNIQLSNSVSFIYWFIFFAIWHTYML